MTRGSHTNAHLLRQKLDQEGMFILPGVYDCLSARLAESTGFEILFTSGFGISASLLGRPDFGFLTATETLTAVGNIVRAVSTPVVADLDTGYGNALNVVRTVEEAVQLGVAGIILEDQEWPKKCGHFRGKRVIPLEQHAAKIRAAAEARQDSGLVIIGRTDARAVEGLDSAIRRGRAYLEAGADVVFVEAPESTDELKIISKAFSDAPTFANMVEGGRTPIVSARELERLGFKLTVFPLTGLFSAAFAMRAAFAHLRKTGSTEDFERMLDFSQFEEIVRVDHYRDQERRFSGPEA